MYLIFALLIISFVIFMVVAFYAVYHDKKSVLNRTFFRLDLCFAIYALATAFIIAAPEKHGCVIWTKVMAVGLFSFASFALHFFLVYTEKRKFLKKWWAYLIIYLPAAVFITLEMAVGFYAKDYVMTQYGWAVVPHKESLLFWLFNAEYVSYCTASIIIAYLWLKKVKSKREKRQGQTIVLSAFVTLIVSGSVFTFSIFNYSFPNVAPIGILIWALGILYAIVKYKLMLISPEMAAEQILETITESVVIVSTNGKIINANRETGNLSGYTEKELEGEPLGVLFSSDDKFREKNLQKLFAQLPIQNMETQFVSKGKKKIPVIFSASECRDNEGDLLGYIAATRDITNIKDAEEKLKYLAHHDTLTSLPNRLLFVDRFNQETKRARRNKTHVAVFLLDLDHFKDVNDGYGHNVGDLLLIEVSNRLRASIRQSDSIARLGGDEFVILLSDLKNADEYMRTADRIVTSIASPYIIEGKQINVTISVGVSIYPDNGSNLDSLLKNADIAMYKVKNGGRNNYRLFTPVTLSVAGQIEDVESELREALVKNELLLYYQPMVDLYSETIIGAEALIRWNHPKYGIISPADFIPQAEETGLIVPLGDWVLKTACKQAKKWQESNLENIYVSVNLSSFQFRQKDLAGSILDILNEAELPPEYLLLEITESNIIKDKENVGKMLRKLNEHKVRVVISGFGTGYSSLLYLKEFPIYAIKIDRFFIRNIANDPGSATIIKAIISLAHDLGVKVIAEGIETREQSDYLRALEWKPANPIKCDGAQGFLYSKPVPESSLTEVFEKHGSKKSP